MATLANPSSLNRQHPPDRSSGRAWVAGERLELGCTSHQKQRYLPYRFEVSCCGLRGKRLNDMHAGRFQTASAGTAAYKAPQTLQRTSGGNCFSSCNWKRLLSLFNFCIYLIFRDTRLKYYRNPMRY
jgi:hypothetical protein